VYLYYCKVISVKEKNNNKFKKKERKKERKKEEG
jgi:hypothetical protein